MSLEEKCVFGPGLALAFSEPVYPFMKQESRMDDPPKWELLCVPLSIYLPIWGAPNTPIPFAGSWACIRDLCTDQLCRERLPAPRVLALSPWGRGACWYSFQRCEPNLPPWEMLKLAPGAFVATGGPWRALSRLLVYQVVLPGHGVSPPPPLPASSQAASRQKSGPKKKKSSGWEL